MQLLLLCSKAVRILSRYLNLQKLYIVDFRITHHLSVDWEEIDKE
jgi:hypothetical protein